MGVSCKIPWYDTVTHIQIELISRLSPIVNFTETTQGYIYDYIFQNSQSSKFNWETYSHSNTNCTRIIQSMQMAKTVLLYLFRFCIPIRTTLKNRQFL